MELYYKDLISEDASLEKLVDDLMLVVQGAEEFAQAAGATLSGERKQEITTRLARLKAACQNVKEHTKATALAADKILIPPSVLLLLWDCWQGCLSIGNDSPKKREPGNPPGHLCQATPAPTAHLAEFGRLSRTEPAFVKVNETVRTAFTPWNR